MQFYKRERPHIILVDIGEAEAKRRLLARNRHDDTEEAIVRRLSWYGKEVVPAVNYFKDRPEYHFVEVNGEQEPAEVHQDIINALAL